MMSNCQPCLRAIASARGMLGVSMKPTLISTLANRGETWVMRIRSSLGTRGESVVVNLTLHYGNDESLRGDSPTRLRVP